MKVPAGPLARRLALIRSLSAAWRPSGTRLRGLARSLLTSFVALGAALWILPPIRSSGPVSVLVLAVSVAAVGALLRPVLYVFGVLTGPLGLLLVGIVSQALVLDVALSVTPGIRGSGIGDVLVASWLVAIIAAVINWLFDAGSEEAFFAQLLGRAVRVDHLHGAEKPGGLLIVQLDGVGESVLRQAITAGAVPTISRWLRSGSHSLVGWHTGLPSTTPAAQAALLHRDSSQVPSFRWFEKPTGRLMVANRPRDAGEIEARISTGRGLLADGGVSISNLFSGDAPTRLLTMSDPSLPPPRATRGFTTFVTSRGGLTQSLVVFVGVMLTELQQSRRQRRRNVLPRVRRGGVFVLLRALTTVLLRDLNVAMVVERMAYGEAVIFVDFVDYDEVAHHAGPTRPESIRTLDGLDRVLSLLESVAQRITPSYEIVVLSDHGQAQGATFTQLAGSSLAELVAGLTDNPAQSAGYAQPTENTDSRPAERWGAANLLLTGAARSPRRVSSAMARRLARGRVELSEPPVLEPDLNLAADAVVVAASGNLAHLYLREPRQRVSVEAVTARYPELIAGLVRHPQIGLAMWRSDADGLVARGCAGWRVLTEDGAIGGSGDDPLAVFGPRAAKDLFALDQRAHVGDIVLLGRRDAATGEVTAFEELVGSHGGLGGEQTAAILIRPASWPRAETELTAIGVHDLLVARLNELQLREGLITRDPAPIPGRAVS